MNTLNNKVEATTEHYLNYKEKQYVSQTFAGLALIMLTATMFIGIQLFQANILTKPFAYVVVIAGAIPIGLLLWKRATVGQESRASLKELNKLAGDEAITDDGKNIKINISNDAGNPGMSFVRIFRNTSTLTIQVLVSFLFIYLVGVLPHESNNNTYFLEALIASATGAEGGLNIYVFGIIIGFVIVGVVFPLITIAYAFITAKRTRNLSAKL